MTQEFKVSEELVFLEQFLFLLHDMHFDKEIKDLLDKLENLVQAKNYDNFNVLGLDIEDYELIYRYHLKK